MSWGKQGGCEQPVEVFLQREEPAGITQRHWLLPALRLAEWAERGPGAEIGHLSLVLQLLSSVQSSCLICRGFQFGAGFWDS